MLILEQCQHISELEVTKHGLNFSFANVLLSCPRVIVLLQSLTYREHEGMCRTPKK